MQLNAIKTMHDAIKYVESGWLPLAGHFSILLQVGVLLLEAPTCRNCTPSEKQTECSQVSVLMGMVLLDSSPNTQSKVVGVFCCCSEQAFKFTFATRKKRIPTPTFRLLQPTTLQNFTISDKETAITVDVCFLFFSCNTGRGGVVERPERKNTPGRNANLATQHMILVYWDGG
ncbi:hypothetical protein OUZ56_026154 [Daphnia magna]|uniref:Uncharacterized protein n=1 Tax=Daphnia magna TaxID=35525 RepID=A0ABQ9ZLS0_9CRUS|nr:hypothetical protein OUZ56_026154 [Daphnia magna]